MMFGYACRETPEFMPAPIFYAHAILRSLSEARHAGETPLLGPDAKSQVTLQYIDGKPVRAAKVVVSIQHSDRIETEEVREIVRPYVVATLPEGCTIHIAYAIGVAKPLSFYVDTAGTADEQKLAAVLQGLVDLSPRGIRTHLSLNKPIYRRTAAYGHFGRRPDPDGGFSWERLD